MNLLEQNEVTMPTEEESLQDRSTDEYLMALGKEYFTWRNGLHKEMRGGKLMFDVPKHYKWLNDDELFHYYMLISRSCK